MISFLIRLQSKAAATSSHPKHGTDMGGWNAAAPMVENTKQPGVHGILLHICLTLPTVTKRGE